MLYDKEVEKQKRTEKLLLMFQQVLEGKSYKDVGELHSITGPAVSRYVAEVIRIINHPSHRSDLISAFPYGKYRNAYSDQPELFQSQAAFLNTFTLSRLTVVQLREQAEFLIQFVNMVANPMGDINIKRASSAIQRKQILDLLAYEIKMFLADAYRGFKPDSSGYVDTKAITNHEYITSRLNKMELTARGETSESTFILRQVGAKRFQPAVHYRSHGNMVDSPGGKHDLVKFSVFNEWKALIAHIQGFDYVFA